MIDKVIVSNRKALSAKYGKTGAASVGKAVDALIAADKKRGLSAKMIYVDSAPTMKKLGGSAVTNPLDPRANKKAVDAICKALSPDYLMILGAPDVFPHQDLTNPAYDGAGGDDDPVAFGDLPYACDAPYAKDPAKFVGPTRVVGRLPDLAGAREPSHLIALLKTATAWQSRAAADYAGYFGLSAEVWRGSTTMSLNAVFGNADRLLLAPPSGPAYPNGQLGARMHFINCHGAPAAPEFYGQHGNKYPISLTSAATRGRVGEGTVAAVECCYGASLYDSVTLNIDMPICQSYLEQGAFGYFGSTTIAYGPADDIGSADLICQYFLLAIQEGASLGRAALIARQRFAENAAQMDPIDLKTIAQFCLLGDPSVHPVAAVAPGVPKGVRPGDARRFFRAERRAKLQQAGRFLQQTKATASTRSKPAKAPAQVKTALTHIAEVAGLGPEVSFIAFDIAGGGGRRTATASKVASAPTRYHLAVARRAAEESDKVRSGVAVVAKELNGRIIGYRIYHQR